MPYRIAGIDVHKKKLAVVVTDVEVKEEYQFERRWCGSKPEQLQGPAEWLVEQQVEEVVLESTAQYWKPVWSVLERSWKLRCQRWEGAGRASGTLHLAQALSNRGRRGRKRDFRDAERLVKRLVSQELTLSFVPNTEQRLWRTLTRTRYQRTRDRVRLQNQLEALSPAGRGSGLGWRAAARVVLGATPPRQLSTIRKRAGRRRISREVRDLIFRMVAENPTWGAPRIHGELLMLGVDVSERSIARWFGEAPIIVGASIFCAFVRAPCIMS